MNNTRSTRTVQSRILQLVLARTDPNLKKLSPPWICFFSSF